MRADNSEGPAVGARASDGSAKIHHWLYAIGGLLVLGGFAWVGDKITLQNERTVYTAQCARGAWQGPHCSGDLVAGPRYRFRALRIHGEVLFWTVGDTQPSGKLMPCAIADGRNWTCDSGADPGRTITLQMSRGRPVNHPGVASKPFHAVAKWRWWLLRGGIALGHDAAN